MPLSPGDKLGQYEIVYLLGKDGMGAVYHALDPKLKPVFVVERIEHRDGNFHSWNEYG